MSFNPLSFPPMNNQAVVPQTRVNTLASLTSSSTITAKAISPASGTVSINSAPAVSIAAMG